MKTHSKNLILKVVLPATIISFEIFTKWWYVAPVDAPDSVMIGFPLPYSCEGWHTSGSEQFFILEFLFDFFLYFMFWLLIIYLINEFIVKIQFSKIFRVSLLVIAFLLLLTNGIFTFMPENVFSIKREFGIEIKESHYKFIWQNILRPELR